MKIRGLATAVLLLATASVAQNSRHEASGGFSYSFSTSSTFQGPINITENNKAVLKPSSSFGFLAAYQYHWKPRHGFQANYGYLKNTQAYQVNNTLTGLPLPSSSIKASIQELTGAYVYHTKNIWLFSPFVEGGGGALFFSPSGNANVTVGLSSETRAAYLYGAGADFKLSPKVSLRLQYRGLLYHPPTFNVFTLVGFHSGSIEHMAQPSIAIVYHF